MNKKFLSAILFGALMVSSTGTFVSCKDYDDDIDNINKELTDIKSKLSDLESKVTTGGAYVTKIESVEGGLKVSVSDGTSYNLTIAGTPAGSTVVIDKTTGEISIDGTPTGFFATTGTTPQGESTAPYVKDGFWYFYDDATKAFVKSEYKASGNAWAVQKGDSVVLHIPNEAGVMQEITLPTSSSALTALNATPSNWTSGKNIAWSKAGADVTWAGKKGNVAAGQLLIGQLGSETATVTPASYDLGAQELTLVDIDGKTAPVTVTATAAEGDYVTDRAASPSGKWNLAIAMTDEVTADNIATAFTKKVNGVDKNVKYALAVNGTVMTGYEYVIDTQTVNESKTNTAYNKANIGLASANVALGTSTLSLNAATAAQAYDSYLTFEGASKTLAEAKGITVDGMNITVPATAAATLGLSVTVNILDITGKIAKKDVVLTIAGASVSETETVAPVSIKISTVNSFSVDLGTIFTNLDANIAQNADATKTTVTTADGNFFALTSATSIGDGLYKVAENTAIAFKKADGGAATIAARNAIKAVITLNYTGSKYTTAAKDLANIYGTFNLTLTLKDAQGNELKKVIVPVTVSKPEFDDYYTANQYAGWNEGILSSVIDNSGNSPAFTMPTNLYTINKKADGTGMTDAQPGYTYTYKKAAVDNSEVKEAASITFTDVVKDGFLKTTDYKVKANKEVVTVNALTGASNAAADNTISVSKEFTMKLAPAFNKAKLVYYTNGVAGTVAAVNADGIIAALTEDKTANKPKNGLALQYGDEEIAVSTTAIPASASASNKLGGYQVSTANATSGATIKVGFAKSAESAGGSVTLEAGDTGVKITGLNAGQGGELVVTFTDYAGIKTQATIEYKK
ncbi:hypothetical protein HMPREF1534_03907 [Phocaeicola massiliensis B84634 = Timone 84634 = DSM 17679 = JCM 13223]|uniref:DUF4988 domain-containing protein n=1 Tax=Phocaeicola massiliensis B84634 = Timone 84634 = DSM 17679 = JCM 13223 TaxID=1121098 RepID=U6R861_9BACT|nr:hypothetical protein [Phocaeicola massiliensis]EOA52480.1 hypothetical protein HMPREF1534_03907 [Phocaeicola massiliensis B84634 = Timone 84634 = DSM 17679 = JCM 13223]